MCVCQLRVNSEQPLKTPPMQKNWLQTGGNVFSDGKFLYLDCGGSYTAVYIKHTDSYTFLNEWISLYINYNFIKLIFSKGL